MVIRTKIELKDYLKLAFSLTYEKPLIILIYFMSIVFIILGILRYTEVYFAALFIFYLLLIPILTYFRSKKSFLSNKKIQEVVTYEFTAEKMTSKGESFVSESTLSTLFSIKETNKWFLIYQSQQVANLIPKKDMTEAEIVGLRNIFKSISGVKLKLKA